MKAVINTKIYDYENFIDNGFCIFDDNIIEVGEMKDFPNFEGEIIEGKNKILLPGLINFHTHVYSTLVRGASIPFDPQSFKEILEQLWWKFDHELDNEATYNSALIYGLESLKNGVTSLIDHHASGIDIIGSLEKLKKALVDELGMRGVFCFETSDRFNVEECIEENLSGIELETADAKGIFGLHASMSLSEKTLEKVSEIIKQTPIHVHVAESKEDEIDSMNKYGMSVVERFNKHNLLNSGSIFAHCVHINDTEAKLIFDNHGVIALNPTSNMNNAVGEFNYHLYKKHDIQILIGTDGLGSNIAKEWTNLYYAGKAYIKNPIGIGLDEILNYIKDSYEFYSNLMNIKIGKIREDYVADLVLVDYNNPTIMDEYNAFGHVFYGLFDNFRPSHVFIKGITIIENYRSYLDEDTIYKNALKASRALWDRIGDA